MNVSIRFWYLNCEILAKLLIFWGLLRNCERKRVEQKQSWVPFIWDCVLNYYSSSYKIEIAKQIFEQN